MDDSIRLIDVSKRYHKTEVVKSISFTIWKGSLCAFLGCNGAGKSTTMNMIITLLQKSKGKIYVEGLDIDSETEFIRQQIGVVFQEDVLDQELTVYENLYYRGGLYLNSRAVLRQRMEEVSDLLSLSSLLPKRYCDCSGGQKRLVQIGRALLPKPKLLILDEPTIGLDPLAREQVWDILQKLHRKNHLTIFYSTHYMEEASMAEQICMIHQGNLLLCQKVDQLYRTTSKESASRQLHDIYLDLLKNI